jgi:hypothetical protein
LTLWGFFYINGLPLISLTKLEANMKKIFGCILVLVLSLPPLAWARSDVIWRQKNNAANFVRLIGIRGSKAETMALTQPYTFTEDKMADILRSLRYTRRALFTDKIKNRRVFEEETIERYTPLLVKAFAQATPQQMVYMSVAQKRPWYIIREDRLTQVALWVTGQELHLRFDETEAKLGGDYMAHTPEGQKMRARAVGLRIMLEPQQGQKFALDSTDEIIVDISSNWEAIVTQIEAEEEKLRQEQEIEKARGSKKKQLQAEADAKAQQAQGTSAVAAPPPSAVDQKNAEQRLQELKKLKDKGLIDQSDYDKKKEEILRNM